MKKHLVLSFLLLNFCVSVLSTACTKTKPEKTQPPPSFSLLKSDTFGEDFDFSPLPPTRSMPNDVWDVSDIDVSHIDVSKKLIAFTFDDAPASTLENILAVFANYNENNPDCKATATLFCNGNLFNESAYTTLSAAVTLGWELGNHTYSHADITTLSESELQIEIQRTETLLSNIDGKRAHLFRAPYGRINEEIKKAVNVPIID